MFISSTFSLLVGFVNVMVREWTSFQTLAPVILGLVVWLKFFMMGRWSPINSLISRRIDSKTLRSGNMKLSGCLIILVYGLSLYCMALTLYVTDIVRQTHAFPPTWDGFGWSAELTSDTR
jgi:hypothetical protein